MNYQSLYSLVDKCFLKEYNGTENKVKAQKGPTPMKECIFNAQSNNVVGYCRYHCGYMTVKQMRCKNCLSKQCRHLVKNEEHNFWKQRERLKQKKKAKKQMFNDYIESFN